MSNPVIETPELLSVGLSMLIIIGSVVAFGWLYSRMRIGPGGAGNPIEIIASRGLGAKERLLLVQVGDQCVQAKVDQRHQIAHPWKVAGVRIEVTDRYADTTDTGFD